LVEISIHILANISANNSIKKRLKLVPKSTLSLAQTHALLPPILSPAADATVHPVHCHIPATSHHPTATGAHPTSSPLAQLLAATSQLP